MSRRKRSTSMDLELFVALATHAAMGIAVGLGFSLALLSFPCFGVRSLIDDSFDPRVLMATLASIFTLAFAVGASLTGCVLTVMERDERSPGQ
jgi:hypothetical protein